MLNQLPDWKPCSHRRRLRSITDRNSTDVLSNSPSVIQYVTSLRTLLTKCTYPEDAVQDLLRKRFVAGLNNERLRERFLMEPDNLTVENAIELAENFERAKTESEGFSSSRPQADTIQALGTRNQSHNARLRKSSPSPSRFRSNSKSRNASFNRRQFQAPAAEGPRNSCGNCGNLLHTQMQKCPAKGKKCNSCGKIGHFAKCCRSSSNQQKSEKHVSSISPIYSLFHRRPINTIERETESGFKFVSSIVNGKQITLLVDLGAKVSILNLAFINSLQPRAVFRRSTVILTAYGGSQIPQL